MSKLTRTAALFVALCLAMPAQSQPKIFESTVSMGTVQGHKLTNTQKRAFKWYRSKKAYFGAFYIAPGTDHLFWTRNFHSMRVAKEAAKFGCELVSKGAPCTLHAVLYPMGVDPNAADLEGLGQRTRNDFLRKFPKRQKDGKYGAFAINKAYGYGFSFGWESAEEANAAAMAYCAADSSKESARLGIEGRKWVKSKGLEKCRIIATHSPD